MCDDRRRQRLRPQSLQPTRRTAPQRRAHPVFPWISVGLRRGASACRHAYVRFIEWLVSCSGIALLPPLTNARNDAGCARDHGCVLQRSAGSLQSDSRTGKQSAGTVSQMLHISARCAAGLCPPVTASCFVAGTVAVEHSLTQSTALPWCVCSRAPNALTSGRA